MLDPRQSWKAMHPNGTRNSLPGKAEYAAPNGKVAIWCHEKVLRNTEGWSRQFARVSRRYTHRLYSNEMSARSEVPYRSRSDEIIEAVECKFDLIHIILSFVVHARDSYL